MFSGYINWCPFLPDWYLSLSTMGLTPSTLLKLLMTLFINWYVVDVLCKFYEMMSLIHYFTLLYFNPTPTQKLKKMIPTTNSDSWTHLTPTPTPESSQLRLHLQIWKTFNFFWLTCFASMSVIYFDLVFIWSSVQLKFLLFSFFHLLKYTLFHNTKIHIAY